MAERSTWVFLPCFHLNSCWWAFSEKQNAQPICGLWSGSELSLESLESVVWAVGALVFQCVCQGPHKFAFGEVSRNKFGSLCLSQESLWNKKKKKEREQWNIWQLNTVIASRDAGECLDYIKYLSSFCSSGNIPTFTFISLCAVASLLVSWWQPELRSVSLLSAAVEQSFFS